MNRRQGGSAGAAVDLYWLPVGAGGHSVRWNARIYEGFKAARHRRRPRGLYHAALEVRLRGDRYVIEQAPVPDGNGMSRGVVAEGPVGAHWAARLRIFRYEVRVWRGGSIPDISEAIESPRRLTSDGQVAERVLGMVRGVPTLVWGRDELHAGEMWNSNSVIAWVLSRAGFDVAAIDPPSGGSAPGWSAGVFAARAASSGAGLTAAT